MKNFLSSVLILVAVLMVTLPTMQAADPPPPPENVWFGGVNVGLNMTSGNSETLTTNLSFLAEWRSKLNEFKFGIEGNYGEAEVEKDDGRFVNETTVQNGRVFSDYKRLFHEKMYAYLGLEANHDRIADLDYRFLAGPGFGYFFVKTSEMSWGADIGATYIRTEYDYDEEDLSEEKDPDTIALKVTERLEWKLGKTSRIWKGIEYLPSFEDFSIYLLNAELGVEAGLSDRFTIRLVAQDKYNSDPKDDNEHNDLILTAGVGYKF